MQTPSDALVFFGATGDLAFKKIFPALQAMARRGRLDVPVIGVAKAGWNLDQLRARAQNSVEQYGGLDREAFARLSGLRRYERVLSDALEGDPELFARMDYVEEAWRIVDPLLTMNTPVREYEPGTWGAAECAEDFAPPGGWANPTGETLLARV
jgi:glucose-6-phosphate 1-dehydrogenase